ncbi:MAG: Mg2+ and Co2+ transporter CorB [Acetivibrionales bacterium]
MEENNRRQPSERKIARMKPNSADYNSKKSNIRWVIIVTIASFIISAFFSVVSSDILKEAKIFTAFIVILVIIITNIVFDIIGTAVTAAEEAPFHAMASKKFYAARQSIRLIRNADKVSNVCNDIVGDICGIISGAAGAYIILRIIGDHEAVTTAELFVTGMITALTVGGKAFGKIIALRNSNSIIYKVGVITKFITDGFLIFKKRKPGNGRNKRK